MKVNNKGFSLVELLVSFAILGLISTMILGIAVSGTNMFNSNKKVLGLQYKSQVASAQIHNYLQNCDAGVASTGDSLWLAESDGDAAGRVYCFTKEDDGTVNLREFNISVVEEGGEMKTKATYEKESGGTETVEVESLTDSACLAQPLCSGVSEWDIDVGAADGSAKYISLKLTFEQEGSTYTKNMAESFRNRPRYVSEIADGSTMTISLIKSIWG
ncbi:MAG: type II secretion system protein [Clostridia bacterium]|nr:type II secretion system protein [Clostridia bacterium]